MRLVTEAVASPVWAATFTRRKRPEAADDADGVLFSQAQPKPLRDGVEEHHGGVALLAAGAQQSLDLIRTGGRGFAAALA